MALVALAILVLFGLLIIATSYPHDDKRSAPGYRLTKIPRPTNVPGRQLTKRAPAPGQTHIAGYNSNPNIPTLKFKEDNMKLELKVTPKDLIPKVSFHGETYADKTELERLDNLQEMIDEVWLMLLGLFLDTKDRNEDSAKQLHAKAEKMLDQFKEAD
ncbi:hypothetical protein AB0X56_04340 [Weissella paramesenteroides]|uniref:hypothetical protein n=1 Tax=Weissella paramesenteroides TaxID=1249 RepID=UPI003F2572A8